MHRCGPKCVEEIKFKRRWPSLRWEARTSCRNHWLMGWGNSRLEAAVMMIENVMASSHLQPRRVSR